VACESGRIVWGGALSIVAELAVVVKARIVIDGGRSFARIRCELLTLPARSCGQVKHNKENTSTAKIQLFLLLRSLYFSFLKRAELFRADCDVTSININILHHNQPNGVLKKQQ
jgi:hypothetical protein